MHLPDPWRAVPEVRKQAVAVVVESIVADVTRGSGISSKLKSLTSMPLSRPGRSAAIAILAALTLTAGCRFFRQPARGAAIPARPTGAMTGSEFLRKTATMTMEEREAAIVREITRGNMPGFARHLKPVRISKVLKDGRRHTVVLQVMPDYLAVGSDRDFVRMPMNPLSAQKIARAFGMALPTPRVVDEINRQAARRYNPSPLPPGRQMTTNRYYERHNRLIEVQRRGRSAELLASGHKKDVVLTNRLRSRPRQVAIYGWHRGNGRPIQPLSLVHGNYYADYSHGIRLIHATVTVDGRQRQLTDVYADRLLSGLVSDEGPMLAANSYLGPQNYPASMRGKTALANTQKTRKISAKVSARAPVKKSARAAASRRR